MTEEEIRKKIADLEEREFLIQMADFLSREDLEYIYKYRAEIKELKKMLGEN